MCLAYLHVFSSLGGDTASPLQLQSVTDRVDTRRELLNDIERLIMTIYDSRVKDDTDFYRH
jgi:hypothetical protein